MTDLCQPLLREPGSAPPVEIVELCSDDQHTYLHLFRHRGMVAPPARGEHRPHQELGIDMHYPQINCMEEVDRQGPHRCNPEGG